MTANERIERVTDSLKTQLRVYLKARALRTEMWRFADAFDKNDLNAVAVTLYVQCETTLVLSLCRAFDESQSAKLSIYKAIGLLSAKPSPPIQLRDREEWRNSNNPNEILQDAFWSTIPAIRRAGGEIPPSPTEPMLLELIKQCLNCLVDGVEDDIECLRKYRHKRVGHIDPTEEVDAPTIRNSKRVAEVLCRSIDLLQSCFCNAPTDGSQWIGMRDESCRVAKQFVQMLTRAGLTRGALHKPAPNKNDDTCS